MTKLDSVVKSIVSGLLKSNKSISKIEKLVLRKRAEVQVRTVSCSYWDHPNYAHSLPAQWVTFSCDEWTVETRHWAARGASLTWNGMGCWIGSNLCAGGGGGTPGNRHHSKFCEPPSHYMHSSTHEHGHQQRTETWLTWGASAERLSGPCSTTKLWWPEAISAKAGLNIKQELKKKKLYRGMSGHSLWGNHHPRLLQRAAWTSHVTDIGRLGTKQDHVVHTHGREAVSGSYPERTRY